MPESLNDARLSNGETVASALEVVAFCKGHYAGMPGCESCRERVRLIAEREQQLRDEGKRFADWIDQLLTALESMVLESLPLSRGALAQLSGAYVRIAAFRAALAEGQS
jgi:hypothetical protein